MEEKKIIKSRKFLIIFSSLLFVVMLCSIGSISASATDGGNPVLNIQSIAVPEDAEVYAEKVVGFMLAGAVNNPNTYDVAFQSPDDLVLGTPYTIFKANGESVENSGIYYFPILEGQEIKLILSVYQVNGEWSATFGKDIAEQLNALVVTNDENNPYILYSDNLKIYAQNDDATVLLQDGDPLKNALSSFSQLSYDVKKAAITSTSKAENLDANNIVASDASNVNIGEDANAILATQNARNMSTLSYTPGFSTHTYNDVQLNMTYCRVNQLLNGVLKNMCWAASVASIVRYRNGNTTLSASNVCDLLGLSYDNGGFYNNVLDALNYYGVTGYEAHSIQLTFSQIGTQILAKYPVYMDTYAQDFSGKHTVTLTGYSTFGGMNLIYFWDSKEQRTNSVFYSSSGSTYTSGGTTYVWLETIYHE